MEGKRAKESGQGSSAIEDEALVAGNGIVGGVSNGRPVSHLGLVLYCICQSSTGISFCLCPFLVLAMWKTSGDLL